MRRALLAVLIGLPLLTSAQRPPEPLPVVYLPLGGQQEECRQQWQTNAAVRAYSAPTEVSRYIRTIDGLRRVDANDYTEALTAVLRNGRVRARTALRLSDALNLTNDRSGPIAVATGEEFEVLARAPEGQAYFLYRGNLFVGSVPGFSVQASGPSVEVISEPVTELWVRLVEHGADRPAAWLNVSQAGVVEREGFCGG
jgi:hypothetical protein